MPSPFIHAFLSLFPRTSLIRPAHSMFWRMSCSSVYFGRTLFWPACRFSSLFVPSYVTVRSRPSVKTLIEEQGRDEERMKEGRETERERKSRGVICFLLASSDSKVTSTFSLTCILPKAPISSHFNFAPPQIPTTQEVPSFLCPVCFPSYVPHGMYGYMIDRLLSHFIRIISLSLTQH